MNSTPSYTSFDGNCRIASGSLHANIEAIRRVRASAASGPVLTFDDATGRCVDVAADAVDYASTDTAITAPAEVVRGRGRPKLGVVAREVTLLPRHWDWLSGQPGGASVALRKLVEQARHACAGQDQRRQAHERAYHFMHAIAGDLPGFEEAIRALFADDEARFQERIGAWPADVRAHATKLAFDSVTALD